MIELVVTDRITLQPIAVSIADGVIALSSSIGVPSIDYIIADQTNGKYWVLFVSDGVLGHEETELIPNGYVEINDSETGLLWRFQVVDGVLAYVHVLGIATTIDSRIKQDQNKHSSVSDMVAVNSGCLDQRDLNSLIEPDAVHDSRVGLSITLQSKVG
jgi:hypothetical protein